MIRAHFPGHHSRCRDAIVHRLSWLYEEHPGECCFPFSFIPTAPPLLLCHSVLLATTVPTTGSHQTWAPSPHPQSCCHPRVKPPAIMRLRALALTWLCFAEDLHLSDLLYGKLRLTPEYLSDRSGLCLCHPFISSPPFPFGRATPPWKPPLRWALLPDTPPAGPPPHHVALVPLPSPPHHWNQLATAALVMEQQLPYFRFGPSQFRPEWTVPFVIFHSI
jgi:hypothetical protein